MIPTPHSNGDSNSDVAAESVPPIPFVPVPNQGELRHLSFVESVSSDVDAALKFPLGIGRHAVLVDAETSRKDNASLAVLTVPAGERDPAIDRISDDSFNDHTPADSGQTASVDRQRVALQQMRDWVEADLPADAPPSLAMTFQGTQIFWTKGRLAIFAASERLEAVYKALVEVSFYESEVRQIETYVATAWPDLDADIPLAFEMGERDLQKLPQVRERFQKNRRLRTRLARLSPQVYTPHVHPPTLASQVSERLRERTRLLHRYEQLDEQLSIFDEVYEMCGQRSSDFVLARRGHILEWFIIILLVAQTLLYGFEFLSGMGQ